MEIAGIDADQIVSQLMQLEQRPLSALAGRKDAAKSASDAIAKIRASVDGFRLVATRLAEVSSFDRYKASVSHPDVVAASVAATASAGSLVFTVGQLAEAHGLRSVGTVPSSSVAVTTDPMIAVAAGTRPIGVQSVRAGAGLAAGPVQLSVTQASAAAVAAGQSALAASTTIDGSNNSLDVVVNGVARTITIAAGTYDRSGLATAVQSALAATGGGVTASVDGVGTLRLATTREGSTADIRITGGSALGALGLAVDPAARVGTDGVIDVGGTITTVTRAGAGEAVAVDTGAGTLDLVLGGGVRIGASTVQVVSTGDRSLAAVAEAITKANAGVNAAAVRVGTGAWRLQLSATATGRDREIAIDGAVFGGVGGMIESSAALDARITIGAGAGAYDIEASGNTFTDVLSGVTLTAKAVSATPVTVQVDRDDEALASDVAKLVTSANGLLADIKVLTRFDPETRTSGPLAGNGTIRRLADQIRQALGAKVDGSATALPSSAGIELGRDGSFTFDRAEFLTAVAADPAAIARLFGRGGTATGDAVFATAAPETTHGSYAVEVTTAATQATSARLFDGGAVADARIGVRVGSLTATVDVGAGQSAAQIIAALNDSFARSGIKVVAETDGSGLRIRATDWGSRGSFELNEDLLGAGAWNPQAGTDVAGTIDGVVATGIGRRLSLSSLATSPAAGLGVDVAGGAIGTLGPVAYVPGVAARVVEVAGALTRDETGALTTAKQSADKRIQDFNDQITRLEDRLVIREINLRRQWSNMQTLLGGLQSQGDWLSGQLKTLSNNWGPS